MQTTLFPHDEIRAEQDKLLAAVGNTIEQQGQLVVHAPTGLGKTAATLAPAIEYAMQNDKVVIFMTSRLTQHQLAIDTIKKMRAKHNVKISVVDLIGKKHFCLQPGTERLRNKEFAEYCRAMREDDLCEYYSRLKSGEQQSPLASAIITKLGKHAIHTPEEVRGVCAEAKLCPYEITIALAKNTHVLICDYSYLFNEDIRTSLLNRIGKSLNSCILIVDEGHNLPERVKDQASERLTTIMIRRAIHEIEQHGNEQHKRDVQQLGLLIERLAQPLSATTMERLITRSEFLEGIAQITNIDLLIRDLHSIATTIREEQKSSSCGSIVDFLRAWQEEKKGFVRILSIHNESSRTALNTSSQSIQSSKDPEQETLQDTLQETLQEVAPATQFSAFSTGSLVAGSSRAREERNVQLSYRCLDASIVTSDVFATAHATIVMSGTLTPPTMYAQILGLAQAQTLVLASPFPKENRLNIIIPKTSTKFTTRNNEMYKDIATICAQCADAIPGNVALFFPSYHLLNEIQQTFVSLTTKTVFSEHPSFSKEDREQLLERFKMYKNEGAVLLGVMGGSFSEGIDLPGDNLQGVIVVGLPLSRPNLETKALIDYYQELFGKGWEYGYTYPAFNKTLQSAGRCIRTETDRGAIIFIDERYAWQNYHSCFPNDWHVKISLLYEKMLREFFKNEWELRKNEAT